MTTTPRGSRVGLGFAQLLSTLIMCAGLALLAPSPPSSPESVFNEATFALDVSAGASGGQQWASGALENDPPDSDDDDDDGPDGSDSIVLASPRAVTTHVRTYTPLDLPFISPLSSVARDGHSLRAPPR